MATFDELRQQLHLRRLEAAMAREAMSSARDRVLRLEARNAPKDDLDKARQDEERFRGEATAARDRELEALREFGAVADPRTAIAELKDRSPILMFPVRIETRFKPGPPAQLLVRVYPDDCLIDTFESRFSEDEVRAARLYWQSVWAAGRDAGQQRSAWRTLVSTSGAGRARWILPNYFPIPVYPEPKKVNANDLILVISVEAALPDTEADPVLAYWASVWKADGDGAAVESARNTLIGATSAARAEVLIATTRPVNLDAKPQSPQTRATTAVKAALLLLPRFDKLDLKRHSWSSAARSALLPDRFVFLGYFGGTKEVDVLGEPVLSPLTVGPDPSLPDNAQLRQSPTGELIFPDDMLWMVDFERALAAGMGARINLTAAQASRGFSRFIVAGVRLSSDETTARTELETLFDHHRFSRTGLAILPQGTATNNTDLSASGYSRVEDADVSFDEQKRGRLWTETPKWDEKSDGQWLAEYLGVSSTAFESVHGSDSRDLAEARALNTALWPATFGRFLSTLLAPIVPAAGVLWTRGFFTDFVSGRGPLPALRIGSQPYGVLPATPYSRSGWFLTAPPGTDPDVDGLTALHEATVAITADWRGLLTGVSHVGKAGFAPQMLLDIVAAHSGSVEHTWRVAEFVETYKQRLRDAGVPEAEITATIQADKDVAMALLRKVGYSGPDEPALLFDYYHLADVTLGGPLIDDRPLSETAAIRAYTAAGDDNYLAWLFDVADDLVKLREESGFKDDAPPKALLYRFLHAALIAGHRDPAFLPRQIAAVQQLRALPTARLERIFTEHFDCCAYRVDAWFMGLLRRQLVRMRGIDETGGTPTKGVYLGAYAFVENLRPDPRVLKPAVIPDPRVAADFAGPVPLLTDSTNEGFIHAPSLNHAVTAAVLRNGYLSNADKSRPDTFAVNLTSERVRVAMSILEGLRNGQSMGALLGYQFERGLHDRQTEELDRFILSIRLEFPLAANRLASTKSADAAIETIEARNVVDGLALVNQVRAAGAAYPFGKTRLPRGAAAEENALSAEAQRLVETWDAVADLAMSEGVFQAVLGNFDRVGAMLDSLSKGYFPPEPQIVRTPAEGTGLTHRVGLHLQAGLAADHSPVSGLAPTPRSLAEPAVNEWLATLLPPLDQISCVVHYRDGANATQQETVTLRQLNIQPADLLLLAGTAQEELDERVTTFVSGKARPDAPVTIAYMEKAAPKLSLFETLPLIDHLRRLTRAARPLVPTDLARPNDAKTEQDETVRVDRQRIQKTLDALESARRNLADFGAPIASWLEDLPAHRADLVANCDGWIDTNLPALFGRFGLFAIPQSGWMFAYEFRKGIFVSARAKAAEVIDRWNRRLADYDARIAELDALPAGATDSERFALLTRVESTVTTSVTVPLPATPAEYRVAVAARRAAFVARRDQFVALRDSRRLKVKDLLADFEALLPIKQFDLTEISTKSEIDRCATFAEDLVRTVNVLLAEADRRSAAAKNLLAQHDAAATARARVDALTAAAKALLGDEFVIVPELTVPSEQATELASAHASSDKLLEFVRTKVPIPVDSWLYGVARVRERMRDWEQIVLFAGALGRTEPELTPLQLPFVAGDSWMALDFPETVKLEQERLLYTAQVHDDFDPSKPICGLLLDEWTEVIPGSAATSGVAVHYDRPNNEAPQTMLLLTPALTTGAWQWNDVVDALSETLDLAQIRAIEPRHLDDTAYARFLPATVLEDFT